MRKRLGRGWYAILLLMLLLLPAKAGAEDTPRAGPKLSGRSSNFKALLGEHYIYRISFLWFDGLAKGRLAFVKGERDGTYRAVLEAEAMGVAAWISGRQVRRYLSVMEFAPDGSLRPLIHESHIVKGWGKRRGDHGARYLFDYAAGEVRYQKITDGRVDASRVMQADRMPTDMLTAFYNYRIGIMGPLTPGRLMTVPIVARGTVSPMVVEVLSEEAARSTGFFSPGGHLSRVLIDREVFGTGGGWVFVWLDGQGRPARGMIEDVLGLGDVRGRIEE